MLKSDNRQATKDETGRIVNFLDKVKSLRVRIDDEHPERIKIWWPQWIDREMTWKVVHEDGTENSMKISPNDIVNDNVDAVMFLFDNTNWNMVYVIKKMALMKIIKETGRPTRFPIGRFNAGDYIFFKLSKAVR